MCTSSGIKQHGIFILILVGIVASVAMMMSTLLLHWILYSPGRAFRTLRFEVSFSLNVMMPRSQISQPRPDVLWYTWFLNVIIFMVLLISSLSSKHSLNGLSSLLWRTSVPISPPPST